VGPVVRIVFPSLFFSFWGISGCGYVDARKGRGHCKGGGRVLWLVIAKVIAADIDVNM
jgi:hypothetical protein